VSTDFVNAIVVVDVSFAFCSHARLISAVKKVVIMAIMCVSTETKPRRQLG